MKQTAVEFLMKFCLNDLPIEQWNKYNGLFEQAKEMEKQREYETKAYWFGRGVLASRENRIAELQPQTYGSKGSDSTLKSSLNSTLNQSSQTEISDEEIWKAAESQATFAPSFVRGVEWYREQLKKK